MNNKRVLEIPSNNSLIYRQILEFLLVGSKFTNQEKDVIAEYIKLNHEYEALPQDKRNKFIFSQEIKKEIADTLGMKDYTQISTVISTIKKKTYAGMYVIDEDNNINPALLLKPDLNKSNYEIIIKFNNLAVEKLKTNSNIEENDKSAKRSEVEEDSEFSEDTSIITEDSREEK